MKTANSSLQTSKEFLKAAQSGDLARLKDFVNKNGVLDWTVYRHEVSGDTALHLASRAGHTEMTKYLCDSWEAPSFKIEVANTDGKRPLHDAAQFARVDVLEFLLLRGATVDPLKRADWTPLMLACTKLGKDATKCVDSLLRHGAASDLQNKDGWTALLVACRTGNIDAIELLTKHSLRSIYAKSKNGRSPLHIAAFHGHRAIVDLLLSKDSTPLLESIKSGDLSTVEFLIASKASVEAVDNVGQNILHVAAQLGNEEMMKFILENDLIDVNSEASFGITPLMLAEKNKHLGATEILQKATRMH